jgi:hypothetical protein
MTAKVEKLIKLFIEIINYNTMKKEKLNIKNNDFKEIIKGIQMASKDLEAIKGGNQCCTQCWSSCTHCVIGGCISCFGCIRNTEGAAGTD